MSVDQASEGQGPVSLPGDGMPSDPGEEDLRNGPSEARQSQGRRRSTEANSDKGGKRQAEGTMMALVKAIVARDSLYRSARPPPSHVSESGSRARTLEEELGIAMSTRVGGSLSAVGAMSRRDTSVTARIEACYSQIDELDRRAAQLSVHTNWAYYRLGQAYESFCQVSLHLSEETLIQHGADISCGIKRLKLS